MSIKTEEAYWTVLDWIINICFFTDIIINFLTPVINDRGIVDSDLKTIRNKYLKGWFYIDVVASLPLEFIILFFPYASVEQLQMLALLKMPRLLRIGRILKFLENMPYANIMRVVKLFMLFMLISHWIGCFLYFF